MTRPGSQNTATTSATSISSSSDPSGKAQPTVPSTLRGSSETLDVRLVTNDQAVLDDFPDRACSPGDFLGR